VQAYIAEHINRHALNLAARLACPYFEMMDPILQQAEGRGSGGGGGMGSQEGVLAYTVVLANAVLLPRVHHTACAGKLSAAAATPQEQASGA